MNTADLIQAGIFTVAFAVIIFQLWRSKKTDTEARVEAALEDQKRYMNLKSEVEVVKNELKLHKENLSQDRKDQGKKWELLQSTLNDIQKRITDHIKSHAKE